MFNTNEGAQQSSAGLQSATDTERRQAPNARVLSILDPPELVFQRYDQDNDGVLNVQELGNMLQSIGYDVDAHHVGGLMGFFGTFDRCAEVAKACHAQSCRTCTECTDTKVQRVLNSIHPVAPGIRTG